MRIIKFFVGLILIPVCVALTRAAAALVLSLQPEHTAVSPAVLALAGGFGMWILFYFLTPRPVRTYVLAHELTHALWGTLMGARIVRMNVGRERGSVTLTKTNFLITLAPYFFPLYTILIIATYYILSLFYAVQDYERIWLALIGFTWGFHFTFTIASLLQHQPDIKEGGALFSYTVIYMMNVIGICLWVVLVSPATLEQWARFSGQAFLWTGHGLVAAVRWVILQVRGP